MSRIRRIVVKLWRGTLVGILASLVAGHASAASIKGSVMLVGGAGEPKKLPVTVDQSVCGKEKEAGTLVLSPERGVRNAVVWLDAPPESVRWDGRAMTIQMDQQECVFVPRILLLPVGGTVEFLNSDRLLHNIHTVSRDNPRYNRTQPKGRTIPLAFPRPEIVHVTCDLHSWMHAWVVVMDHPFYAVTNANGEFVLPNVPPGRHKLQVWQETLGGTSREVVVGTQDVTGVTVELRAK
jgi:plastocyanin